MSGTEPSPNGLVDRLVTAIVDAAMLDSIERGAPISSTDEKARAIAEYFSMIMLKVVLQLASQAGRGHDMESLLEDIYLDWLSHRETPREDHQ